MGRTGDGKRLIAWLGFGVGNSIQALLFVALIFHPSPNLLCIWRKLVHVFQE